MRNGFLRVAAAVNKITVADCAANVASIVNILNEMPHNPDVVVFPEMCITGYTCADLFHSSTLHDAAQTALKRLCKSTAANPALIVVGMPLQLNGALYNCAVAIYAGHVIAVVPKTYVPNYNEFYEKRWWAEAPASMCTIDIPGVDTNIPFGTSQIIDYAGVRVAVEICEDLWVPVPPSSRAALAGAEVILNLSASDDIIGKYQYLCNLIANQSARLECGYVYASAGFGESSTDLVFDGKAIIAESGRLIAVNQRWQHEAQWQIADIDIQAIRRNRIHLSSFADCATRLGVSNFNIVYTAPASTHTFDNDYELLRNIDPMPFVPNDSNNLNARCDEIINIQVAGLAKRLDAIHCKNAVIGISGGLDSTLALLVTCRTFDSLGIDRKGIIGVTMPGYGTTDRTYDNSIALMRALGITIREISIVPAVDQHFADIGHNPTCHDVTYENSQARERTQLLMDIANQVNGIVIGTGDMSELALGWATYNGDHMSMYGVNVGVPKTLVRSLVQQFADTNDNKEITTTLLDIIDTPISPELIPADKDGKIAQKTEDLVGPYVLHDFFLYYTLRYGFSPRRIYLLAVNAFGKDKATEIKKWLRVFFRRFFAQQFKRSCLPDGPKVGSVCLSPRGDWRMPSDASAAMWLDECDSL